MSKHEIQETTERDIKDRHRVSDIERLNRMWANLYSSGLTKEVLLDLLEYLIDKERK